MCRDKIANPAAERFFKKKLKKTKQNKTKKKKKKMNKG